MPSVNFGGLNLFWQSISSPAPGYKTPPLFAHEAAPMYNVLTIS